MTKIPYFEGDFWLNVIEETIKELEARERKASEQAAGKVGGASPPLKLALHLHFRISWFFGLSVL